MKKIDVLNEIKGYAFMLAACVVYSAGTVLFLAPSSIVAGGISGLAVLLHLLNENIPIGVAIIAMNIPILLLGLKMCGWKFIVKCLITIACLGVITDLMSFFPPVTDNKILASLYGGLCQGIGLGLYVRYEFSSGGTELLGRVIARVLKISSIPLCVSVLDGIIVILGAVFTQNPDNRLYALIVVFVSMKVSEIIVVGIEKSKLCIIISDKGEEISKVLIDKSPRGITMLEGEGMYTQKQHKVLLTCVKDRQLSQLKQIVKSVDQSAFMIINESVEVRGKGFSKFD